MSACVRELGTGGRNRLERRSDDTARATLSFASTPVRVRVCLPGGTDDDDRIGASTRTARECECEYAIRRVINREMMAHTRDCRRGRDVDSNSDMWKFEIWREIENETRNANAHFNSLSVRSSVCSLVVVSAIGRDGKTPGSVTDDGFVLLISCELFTRMSTAPPDGCRPFYLVSRSMSR